MKPARPSFRRQSRNSFTLVEMLVVIAITAIVISLSIPAYLQISQSSLLTTTTNQVVDQLTFARKEALTLNQTVEVRFYQLPAPNNSAANIYRGMQSFAIALDNATNANSATYTTNALTHPIIFPSGVEIANPAGSANSPSMFTSLPVVDQSGTSTTFSLPNAGNIYTYSTLRFKSDGSTTTNSAAYVTLFLVNNPPSGTTLPHNWATVQVDPLTGRVQTFRP